MSQICYLYFSDASVSSSKFSINSYICEDQSNTVSDAHHHYYVHYSINLKKDTKSYYYGLNNTNNLRRYTLPFWVKPSDSALKPKMYLIYNVTKLLLNYD